jgi:Protein of unknwon function (DUF3310)
MPSCKTCANYGTYPDGECNSCTPIYASWKLAKTPLSSQEGGDHYKNKAIQPIVYIHANKLGFCEGNVVKYITRHREKNGAEDIRKVIHYCELLLELEYKNE